MPRDPSQSTDGKELHTGRRGYLKMAAGGLVGAAAMSSSIVGSATAAGTVDLGDEGLQEGDAIDGYLEEHLESGTIVQVPAGEYEWRGGGISGQYRDAGLVGDGDVTFQYTGEYWYVNVLAMNGGDFRIENVTIRGQIDSGANKSRFRFDARDPDSTITLRNFNLPDGDAGNGRAIGIYVGSQHEGTVHLDRCHVEGFPNNGLYAGAYGRSGGGGGRVVVENSFFKNNNIDAVRLGGDGDTIRNCVIVQEEVPAIYTGAKSGRGIRVRYPGDDVTVENVHITCETSSPFIVPDRSNGPSGQIDGLYIENNTGATAAYVEQGSFDANELHVTGSGNRNVTGFDATANVYTQANAESPATSLAELGVEDGAGDGSNGDGDGDSDDNDGSGGEGDESRQLPRTLTIEGSSGRAKAYHFEVSGEVAADANINPDDDVGENTVDGRMYSSVDSYRFSGEVQSFESDSLDEMAIYVDGSRVDPTAFGELPNELVIEGTGRYEKEYSIEVTGELAGTSSLNPDDTVSGSTAEGAVWWSTDRYRFSGELDALDVDSPEDVTVSVNGTEVDPSNVGSQPLPNRVVIDGTTIEGTATYSMQVTDTIEGSADLGTLESDDEISGSTVTGTIEDDLDGYRFAGNLVAMNVDGGAIVTIEQTGDR